jgi:hypothetical protein
MNQKIAASKSLKVLKPNLQLRNLISQTDSFKMTRNNQNSNSSLSFLSQHSLRLTNNSLNQGSTSKILIEPPVAQIEQRIARNSVTPQPTSLVIQKTINKSVPKTASLGTSKSRISDKIII